MDSTRTYPRLLRRVRAVLIDSVIAIFVIFSWWMLLPFFEGHSVAAKLAYPLIAWLVLDPILVSRIGSTPGHYIMGLVVQNNKTSENIGLLRAILRSLLRTLTGWWSFIFVLATCRHQALHDVLVGTLVILRDPASLPKNECIDERALDARNFTYPSRVRRILIIFIYITLSFVAMVLVNTLLISESCLNEGNCRTLDAVFSYAVSILWFFSIGGAVVYGWRCHLFGARRKPIVNAE